MSINHVKTENRKWEDSLEEHIWLFNFAQSYLYAIKKIKLVASLFLNIGLNIFTFTKWRFI